MAEQVIYMECDGGWKSLVDPIVARIQETGGRVDQIKEKYGTLRIYYTPGEEEWDDTIDNMISEAERKSASTCEICGQPGSLLYKHGWYKTLCKKHADSLGFKERA
jgi:hypothetical protein